MTDLRRNDDLDDVFLDAPAEAVNHLPRRKTGKRKATGVADAVRRRAFRVLALLADLSAADRAKVLRAAERLNRA